MHIEVVHWLHWTIRLPSVLLCSYQKTNKANSYLRHIHSIISSHSQRISMLHTCASTRHWRRVYSIDMYMFIRIWYSLQTRWSCNIWCSQQSDMHEEGFVLWHWPADCNVVGGGFPESIYWRSPSKIRNKHATVGTGWIRSLWQKSMIGGFVLPTIVFKKCKANSLWPAAWLWVNFKQAVCSCVDWENVILQ